MDPAQSNDAIQQFIKLLEENGRQGQDLSQLLWYMDGMSRQFEAVSQELREVKAQLAQERQPAVKKVIESAAASLKNKLEQARDMLAGLREWIADCAKNAAESFKEAGVSVLDKAISAVHKQMKNVLESEQECLSEMIADTKQNIEKVENIGHELRSVGGHLKNAGRAVAGRETQAVDGGQEGRFQSAVLAPMRATQKLLSIMNNATLAAIGGVEHLEQKAETARERRAERMGQKPGKRLEKKPSIRRALAEKKLEATDRSAPAPVKEHKAPEAAL